MTRFATRLGDYQANNPTATETSHWLKREEDELELQGELQQELIRFLTLTPRQQGWVFQARAYDYLLSRHADPDDGEPKLSTRERVVFTLKFWAYDGLSWWVLKSWDGRSWSVVNRSWWWLVGISRLSTGSAALALIHTG
jgi:hypothetical protein